MGVATPRVTYTDLLHLPDDGRRFELYDGEVFELSAPIPRHQVILNNLKRQLEEYAVAHGGLSFFSPLDIVFSEYDVVQPDVVYFAESRRHLIDFDKPTRHAPDVVIEVLSPSTVRNDRGRKMAMFARYGVPEYWIADPVEERLEVFGLEGGDYRLEQSAAGSEDVRSCRLPQLQFPASRAFRLP